MIRLPKPNKIKTTRQTTVFPPKPILTWGGGVFSFGGFYKKMGILSLKASFSIEDIFSQLRQGEPAKTPGSVSNTPGEDSMTRGKVSIPPGRVSITSGKDSKRQERVSRTPETLSKTPGEVSKTLGEVSKLTV